MTVEELRAGANKLPERERGSLTENFLATLGSGDYDVSDEEVLHRVEESKSGRVQTRQG
jgi:hypothetical protein